MGLRLVGALLLFWRYRNHLRRGAKLVVAGAGTTWSRGTYSSKSKRAQDSRSNGILPR